MAQSYPQTRAPGVTGEFLLREAGSGAHPLRISVILAGGNIKIGHWHTNSGSSLSVLAIGLRHQVYLLYGSRKMAQSPRAKCVCILGTYTLIAWVPVAGLRTKKEMLHSIKVSTAWEMGRCNSATLSVCVAAPCRVWIHHNILERACVHWQ